MWKSSTHCGGVVFCRSWRAFTRELIAALAGRGHVGALAPPRFCLCVAGVVAIFVCEADIGVVPFASFLFLVGVFSQVWGVVGCGWFSCWREG